MWWIKEVYISKKAKNKKNPDLFALIELRIRKHMNLLLPIN
jgi:hypothetical protein